MKSGKNRRMNWLRGLPLMLLVSLPAPASLAQVADQKLGACDGGAGMYKGEIVSALALSLLGQDYIDSQSNDETILMTKCAGSISYYICANDPINDRIGAPALLDDAKKGAIIGGGLGLFSRKEGSVISGAFQGAFWGSLIGGANEILDIAKCGKERDEVMAIATRAKYDWRIYRNPTRLRNAELALSDLDAMLFDAVQKRRITRVEHATVAAMIEKWARWLVR